MFDPAMFDSAPSPRGAVSVDPTGTSPTVAIATVQDLAELGEWLQGLDEHAYGRVFIEGDPAGGIAGAPGVNAPDHVGVTWLRPQERPGEALSAAVDAWFAEWLWVDAAEARDLQMFTARHAGQVIAPYLTRFECKLEKRWPGCSRENCPRLRDTN